MDICHVGPEEERLSVSRLGLIVALLSVENIPEIAPSCGCVRKGFCEKKPNGYKSNVSVSKAEIHFSHFYLLVD